MDRSGEEGFEGIFRQLAEGFEAAILERFHGEGQHLALPRDPAGEAFLQLQADAADLRRVRTRAGAQDQFGVVDQVQQAGVAQGEVLNQFGNRLQRLIQAELAHHQAAHPLVDTELLFQPLEPAFEISSTWPRCHYPTGRALGRLERPGAHCVLHPGGFYHKINPPGPARQRAVVRVSEA